MNSSHRNRAPNRGRRAVLTAEPLEGRALLSSFAAERLGLMQMREERLAARRERLHPKSTTTTQAPPSASTTASTSTAVATAGTASPDATTTPPLTTPTTSGSSSGTTAMPSWAGGYGFGGRFGRGRGFAMSSAATTTGTSSSGTSAIPSLPGGFGMARGFGMGGLGGGMAAVQGGGGSTTSTNPQFAAIQQYQTDVKSIYDKSQVTPALQSALTNDLQAISKAATTAPDQTKVLALQSDLQTLAGSLPTTAQLTTLQADFTAAVNSEGVTNTTQINQTFADLNALIAATNVTATDITTLTNDLKAAGLSTATPLMPPLGVNLDVLNLAINVNAGSTTTPTTTSASTMTPATTTTTTTS